MNREELINIFKKSTTGKKYIEAKLIIENELISDFNINSDEFCIDIKSDVISDNLMSSYLCKLSFDIKSLNVIESSCTCEEFEKFEFSKKNYCCNHLIATFYRSLDSILEKINENKLDKSTSLFKNDLNLLDIIKSNETKKNAKIEVYIEREPWDKSLKVYFKIGANGKYYVLKDLSQFLIHYYNKIPLYFGKDFSFSDKEYKFSDSDKQVINFIELISDIDSKNSTKFIKGKYIKIPKHILNTFLFAIAKSRVYLGEGFYLRDIEAEIINDNPNLNFNLIGSSEEYTLCYEGKIIDRLSNNIFRIDNTIYISNQIFASEFDFWEEFLENNKKFHFLADECEISIFEDLIPKLNKFTNSLEMNGFILNKMIDSDVMFRFYLDAKRDKLILTLKVKYDDFEFNIFDNIKDKYIYRKIKKENAIISFLNRIGFVKDAKKNEFIFNRDEEGKFNFFKFDILDLQKRGDIFYSDKVKGIKAISSNNLKVEVSAGKENYFDFKFDIDGIETNEISKILKAIGNDKRYYKLKTGEIIDLELIELQKLASLINSFVDKNNLENELKLRKYNMLYLSNIDNTFLNINDKDLSIQKLSLDIKDIYNDNYTKSNSFNAELREYQKDGYKWFKTIDYLEAGGILADEMGLGKTVQTLSFLDYKLKNNTRLKTIITAPNSLIYNWAKEIEKFTELKYAILVGEKNARLDNIESFKHDDTNILITTYGTLKNDIKFYEDIEFDIQIIDEAQYIKNSKSDVAKTVKKINSKLKFALTGTPIENSVTDLWSIFDYIMPNYLKSEKEFNMRYNKNLRESEDVFAELKKLTSPFILRRYKKDVLSELPDKIIKDVIIPLDKENKKVYGVYSKNIESLIENGESLDSNFTNTNRLDILAHLTKLRQICINPSVVVDGYKGNSSKIDILIPLVKEKIEEGHKILIFSQFTSILKTIETELLKNDLKSSYLDGKMNIKAREKQIVSFKEGINDIFLISSKAGGNGLNLTEADIVIHFDPWWNPAVEDQATDRAHRIGQEKSVEILRFIAKDTIEEKVVSLQDRKRNLITNVLDSKHEKSEKVDFNDIINILRKRDNI